MDLDLFVGLFAYVAPETLLPVASGLASVVGVVLVLGRGTFRFAGRCLRFLLRR